MEGALPKPAVLSEPISYPAESLGLNAFTLDVNLQRSLARLAPGVLDKYGEALSDFGAWVGGPLDEQASYSDRVAPPRLETHSRGGDAVSRVILNPRYTACHEESYRRGVIGLAYGADAAPHLLSFAMGYMLSQADISIHCPVTMTGAVAYVLDQLAPPSLRDRYLPLLTRLDGQALSAGTWATELHGGSDVGATTTVARRDGEAWRLTGLKWFTSNAGSGLAMATARPEGAPPGSKGLGCYLVPEVLPDGEPNGLWLRRLKDKLGTRGLATGEMELNDSLGWEIAGPPNGLKAMLEALEYSRIHNAVSGCGVQRRAFVEAMCWSSHREAFGGRIARYPMVQDTLLDMQMELEADCALAFCAAQAFDLVLADEGERPWLRLVTALAKYRTAENAVSAAKQAVELVGGNGYTEEWPTARLYRDALVLTVWEGPSNVQALELLRMVAGKLPGDALLIGKIEQIIATLPAALRPEGEALGVASGRCKEAFAVVRSRPEDGPRHAKRLLAFAADVFAGAKLLEAAGQELVAGDARKAYLARRFVAAHFGAHNPIRASDEGHTQFAAITGYGRIAA